MTEWEDSPVQQLVRERIASTGEWAATLPLDRPVSEIVAPARRRRHRPSPRQALVAIGIAAVLIVVFVVPLPRIHLGGGPTNSTAVPNSKLPGGALAAAPDTPVGQLVSKIVIQQEKGYFLDPPAAGTKIVSYVITSPMRAFAFLNNVDFGSGYFSDRICPCSGNEGVGESGTPSAELGLIPYDHGPAVLVELAGGSQLNAFFGFELDGPPCLRSPCSRQPMTEYRAAVAFLLISIDSHKLVGGMVASPGGRTPDLSLSPLGHVTSFLAPNRFGTRPTGRFIVEEVDKPHQTSQ